MRTTLNEIALVAVFGVLLVVELLALGFEPTPLEMTVVGTALVAAIVATWRRGTKTERSR